MAEATKSILITGASSGIGRATALRLARNGWRVFATVRKDTDAEQIEAKAVGALETVRLDVGDKDSIAAAAAEVESRLNGRGLDGLFNNAGIGSVAPVEHTSLDALRDEQKRNFGTSTESAVFVQVAATDKFIWHALAPLDFASITPSDPPQFARKCCGHPLLRSIGDRMRNREFLSR
jgi:NAD(P)-dependent dehydrogenase (short-subunit alcohol dehydrogenase family)